MRRSGAPSRLGVKRPRFTPPFANREAVSVHSPAADMPMTPANNNMQGQFSRKFAPPSCNKVAMIVHDERNRIEPNLLLSEHTVTSCFSPNDRVEDSELKSCLKSIENQLGADSQAKTASLIRDAEKKVENIACISPHVDKHVESVRTERNVPLLNEMKVTTANKNPGANLAENIVCEQFKDDNTDNKRLEKHTEMKVKFVPPTNQQKTLQQTNTEEDEPGSNYYSVLWCKMSKKKHKKWEGDAVLVARGKSVRLIDLDGKEIGKSSGYKTNELSTMEEGHSLFIGGKEIEVMNRLSKEDWTSGRCFNTAAASAPIVDVQVKPRIPALTKGFTKPTIGNSSVVKASQTAPLKPLFDPSKPDALVLPHPTPTQQWNSPIGSRGTVDVVVDPHLSKKLRPHQRQGVVFLYECVMGIRNGQGCGAILADDMGLGKTLQCITLIWTLLKQNPFGVNPVVRRVLIITPGSLVKNWCREFRKWLGVERIKVFGVTGESKVEEFLHSPIYPVMVISYEMFVRSINDVRRCKFDILICDEGHRLKNTGIKTTSLLSSLPVKRRILLTGTPVQNDLQEFYSLLEFCNPGVLGSSSSFHHVYEAPIVRSRQPDATSEEKQLGLTRGVELSRITKQFVLRRTQDINNKYLPPKVENVVFCRPSTLQLQLYQALLKSRVLKECLVTGSSGTLHLMCIAAIKKLCSGPSLILPACLEVEISNNQETNSSVLYQGLHNLYPDHFTSDYFSVEYSGKLKVLSELLHSVHQEEPASKVVVVSAYTQTLDLLQRLCDSADYSFCRLDGSTPTAKRQQIVESFNSKYSTDFVFLLSSKAGGVGLNLIGASRLVLYDVDWNPANDLQAMARVWRDGQTKDVHIYRLLTTGTIEEKIYQRQISKQGLSGAVVDANIDTKSAFSTEELKDLFTLHDDSPCVTHDLLNCDCALKSNAHSLHKQTQTVSKSKVRQCQLGRVSKSLNQRSVSMDELLKWQHIPGPNSQTNQDPHLQSETITFIFRNEVNQPSASNT
ncbi:DNA repair and recombination protein RAD54B-like [Anneissia japonica]|uniref:DNA repair and recombination protein RAD54B-like n=1 Tax=Anneissia japonica TaxID=1529436 RepID=UPI001425A68E|nr:DNA repair and recombination protein RAD54B-like [Anneissia japonica]